MVFLDKHFRDRVSNVGIFKVATRKSGILSLVKEKLHQYFTGAIGKEKIWKKIPHV